MFLPKFLKTNKINTATLLYSCRSVLVITAENVIQQSVTSDLHDSKFWLPYVAGLLQYRHPTLILTVDEA